MQNPASTTYLIVALVPIYRAELQRLFKIQIFSVCLMFLCYIVLAHNYMTNFEGMSAVLPTFLGIATCNFAAGLLYHRITHHIDLDDVASRIYVEPANRPKQITLLALSTFFYAFFLVPMLFAIPTLAKMTGAFSSVRNITPVVIIILGLLSMLFERRVQSTLDCLAQELYDSHVNAAPDVDAAPGVNQGTNANVNSNTSIAMSSNSGYAPLPNPKTPLPTYEAALRD